MRHDAENTAPALWSDADALAPFAANSPRAHEVEPETWGEAPAPAWSEAEQWEAREAYEALDGAETFEPEFTPEAEWERDSHEHEHGGACSKCRCPQCFHEHEANHAHEHDYENAEELAGEYEQDGRDGIVLGESWETSSWGELELPSSVFEDEHEHQVDHEHDAEREFEGPYELEGATQTGFGLSPLAQRTRLHRGHAKRKAPWDKQIYGLVVHTTGGQLPGKAVKAGRTPHDYAVDYYLGSGGTHYVNGWGGADAGHLRQVMNETVQAWGVGVNKKEPQKDQWKSVAAGRFESDLPATVVRLWRARWPGFKDSLALLPVRSSVNATYVHVECTPCVYYRDGSGPLITAPNAQPLRPGLRFTRAQHETVARLAWDIASRHGWPRGEAWWRTPRLVGHEDVTPLSRFDKSGCWDPGGLRDAPYFDWPFVYSYLEQLQNGTVAPAPSPIPASSSSSVFGLLGGLADRFRQLIQTGQEVLAITEAARSGQTDVNDLANLVFFARHPELGGRKLRPEERDLAQEWLRIRDTVVRPVLSGLNAAAPRPTATQAATPVRTATGIRIDPTIVAKIGKYAALVEAAAKKHGVDAALVRGVIAAESGGRADLVASSGYTGLMQSERNPSHKDPQVSIDAGTKKLRAFRGIMEEVLAKRGQRYADLPEAEQLRLLALAYNAGPVTVAKALQYAAEAGRAAAWLDAAPYRRALLFTGAYSTRQAAAKCQPNASAQQVKDAEAVRLRHSYGSKNWRTFPDPAPWLVVGPTLPAFVRCAIEFKHEHSPGYANKILAYRDHFRSHG